MKNVLRFCSPILCILTIGCASIVHGNSKNITIRCYPSPADVVITDEHNVEVFHGQTPPGTVRLKSGQAYFHGKNYKVTISKPGYIERTEIINSRIVGWYWGNFGFGGVIGLLIVDPLTGAMFTLKPDHFDVSLVPAPPFPPPAPPETPASPPPVPVNPAPPAPPPPPPPVSTAPPPPPPAPAAESAAPPAPPSDNTNAPAQPPPTPPSNP
jgi:hypothetical protein